MRPDRFFLIAGLAYGLVFVFATPPFQAPDETAHFYRAYAVSEGSLLAQRGEGGLGAMLPASVQQLGTQLKGDLPGNPDRRIAPEKIFQSLRVPLETERRRFTDFRTAALVFPVSYLPQAAGIAVARWLGAPTLVLLYTARLFNLLVSVALIGAGLRQLPSYRWLSAMIALTPMAVFLCGSASADGVNIAVAFLLAGTIARLAWGEASQGWRDPAIVTACSAVLCLSKAVYAPLAFLALLIPPARLPGGRRSPFLVSHLAIAAAAFALALTVASAVDLSIRPDAPVDAGRQIQDALAHPFRVAGIIADNYLHLGLRYIAQIVGQLGWLDVNLPKPLLWGYSVLLGGLLLFDTRRDLAVHGWQRIVLSLLAVATAALVSAAQYALWTPYGASYVEGVQGRYFLPLAPAAAWIFYSRRFAVQPALLDRLMPWLSLLALSVAVWTLLHRYYGA